MRMRDGGGASGPEPVRGRDMEAMSAANFGRGQRFKLAWGDLLNRGAVRQDLKTSVSGVARRRGSTCCERPRAEHTQSAGSGKQLLVSYITQCKEMKGRRGLAEGKWIGEPEPRRRRTVRRRISFPSGQTKCRHRDEISAARLGHFVTSRQIAKVAPAGKSFNRQLCRKSHER